MSEEQPCTTNITEQEQKGLTEMEIRAGNLALLRAPFPPNQISKLPKATVGREQYQKLPKSRCSVCGGYHASSNTIHLDYVGHAALTDRLLEVDPFWTWEPLSFNESGLPQLDMNGGMWIKLTICGVTRLGYGDAAGKTGGNAVKELIGDALRNAAMRFGAALELWHKGVLNVPNEPKTDIDGSEVDMGKMDKIISDAVDIINSDDMEEGPASIFNLWDNLTNNEKIVVNNALKKMSIKTPSGKDKKYSTMFKEYLEMAHKRAELAEMEL